VAQFKYANCLHKGWGVAVDLINAAKYYELAADQNHAEAQFNYAVCLHQGYGVAVDLIEAAKYYKLAADQNHAKAQFNYAKCLHQGHGVPVDLVEAAKYYKLAADQNLAEAQFNYAVCLRHGDGVAVDLVTAAQYYKLAAHQNDAEAQFNYALCLRRGDGVAIDLVKAAKYLKLAADQNDAKAQFNYANCLHQGYGVPIDLVTAGKYYKLAADQNHDKAQFAYGEGLEFGSISAPNAKRAVFHYERGAESGNCDAQRRLGHFLEFGEGIPRNAKQAAECYRLSAENGDIQSAVAVGFCTEHGIGVKRNVFASLAFYQAAARQKDSDGAFHCALLHQYGIGGDEDLDESASYYQIRSHRRLIPQNSFRCLRIPKKAPAPRVRLTGQLESGRPLDDCTPACRARSLSQSDTRRGFVDDFTSVRSLTVPQDSSSYLTSTVGSETGRVIGTGGFSKVTVRQDRITGDFVAVKHVSEFHQQFFMREVETLVKLNHPCVLRIRNWAPSKDRKDPEIHMEFATYGSLKEVLEKVNAGDKPTFWNPTGIGSIICGFVLGMRYVHWRQILHLDLKPSNILVNGNGHPLVGDFGSSRLVSDSNRSDEMPTVHYAAPELYKEGAKRTTKCDVFSFGLVLYELLVRKPVFDPSEHPFAVIRRLRAMDLPEIPVETGSVMTTLIRWCWETDPEARPSFQQIFKMFESCRFEILPAADPIELGNFCTAINRWEVRAGIRF
jgi:TPR repeat protein